jgi:hypothetical protein
MEWLLIFEKENPEKLADCIPSSLRIWRTTCLTKV